MIELTHQSYESFMNMPYKFFENFYTWKTDMERDKIKRQKTELENQQKLQTKIKAEHHQNQTKNRLKQQYKR